MDITREKILLIADEKTAASVKEDIGEFQSIQLLETKSANHAFELIYNHTLVLVIIDAAFPDAEPYKIGTILMSHKQIHNTPLLIITDQAMDDPFFNDFQALQIDFIIRPYTKSHLCAKVKIFYELFKQKKAVRQSLNELDNVYQKVGAANDQTLRDDTSLKLLTKKSITAANQIQQALSNLNGNLYPLLRDKRIDPTAQSRLSTIRAAADQISLMSKKMISQAGKSQTAVSDTLYRFLYIQDNDTDFKILDYALKSTAWCRLYQAKTIREGFGVLSEMDFHLIFIDLMQPESSGFEILSRLNRMRTTVPVIFTLDKSHSHLGPVAVSKGAFSYIIKEEISGSQVLDIIHNTLEMANLSREVEDARNRIVTISRKDHLTRLYNKRCFEQALESEIEKAKRYRTNLSIVLIDFDRFQAISQSYGVKTGDRILTTSAAMIQSMARTNDVVCRYGEEEFGLVLPNTPASGARVFAERIRKILSEHEFISGDHYINLTVSLGVAAFDTSSGATYSGMVRNGFSALSSALEMGGNCVKTYNKKDD